MDLIEKDTPTHRIQVEFAEESIVDGKDFLVSLTSLALLIKPNETRVKQGKTFRIVLQAKYNYSAEDFFVEHTEFMDSIIGPKLEH